MSNVGSNEKNSSDINTTDVDFLFADTDLQALFDIDFELQNVPVANTEYHPLLEGGEATGCGIDTKVELCKISEKYHFLIDQWHCIYSLEICIKYNITLY
jgi:hypothetical protein